MLDHIAPLCLTFEELLKCFPNLLHYFTFPLAMYEGSNFFTSSLTFVFVHLFDSSYPSGCEIVSHCGFDLHFNLCSGADSLGLIPSSVTSGNTLSCELRYSPSVLPFSPL